MLLFLLIFLAIIWYCFLSQFSTVNYLLGLLVLWTGVTAWCCKRCSTDLEETVFTVQFLLQLFCTIFTKSSEKCFVYGRWHGFFLVYLVVFLFFLFFCFYDYSGLGGRVYDKACLTGVFNFIEFPENIAVRPAFRIVIFTSSLLLFYCVILYSHIPGVCVMWVDMFNK